MPARNKGTTTCCMTSFTRRRQRVEQWRTGTQLHYTCKKSSQGMTMNQRIVELCWAFANERTNENTTPSFTSILWQCNRSKKSYLHGTTLQACRSAQMCKIHTVEELLAAEKAERSKHHSSLSEQAASSEYTHGNDVISIYLPRSVLNSVFFQRKNKF